MTTLDINQAAALVKMHSQTVRHLAINGKIPAAKPGKCWVFIESDLLDWLRGQYIEPRQEAKRGDKTKCYTKEKIVPITGTSSKSTKEQYKEALARARKKKPRK